VTLVVPLSIYVMLHFFLNYIFIIIYRQTFVCASRLKRVSVILGFYLLISVMCLRLRDTLKTKCLPNCVQLACANVCSLKIYNPKNVQMVNKSTSLKTFLLQYHSKMFKIFTFSRIQSSSFCGGKLLWWLVWGGGTDRLLKWRFVIVWCTLDIVLSPHSQIHIMPKIREHF